MKSSRNFTISLLFPLLITIGGWILLHQDNTELVWSSMFLAFSISVLMLGMIWFFFPPKTAHSAKQIRYFNWLFAGIWAAVLLAAVLKQASIELAFLGFAYLFLLLGIGGFNKFLYAQEFPNSDTAAEIEYPFYATKHSVDMLKSYALGFPAGIALILALLAGLGTDTPWWKGAVFGFCVGLFLSFWFLPSLFVKQTAHPSLWQRFCRTYTLWLILSLLASNFRKAPTVALLALTKLQQLLPQKYNFLPDRDYYKFWLSHPGVEITPELCQKINQLNLDTFDWQDPNAWPLK